MLYVRSQIEKAAFRNEERTFLLSKELLREYIAVGCHLFGAKIKKPSFYDDPRISDGITLNSIPQAGSHWKLKKAHWELLAEVGHRV